MICGWDIGGVNTKVARVSKGVVIAVRTRPFELQRAPDTLATVLRELAIDVGAGRGASHALTMTAELSQMFRTKRDGVMFVLDAVERAFPGESISVFTVDGDFVTVDIARQRPLVVAAANWAATAAIVARTHPDALLVDLGSTTTDIIPIVQGRVVAAGRTDPERLASGELVYSGAVRTPVEAIVGAVPFRDGMAHVSAEGFALTGDVHVWRGDLPPEEYTWGTPDGRPPTREFAGERLARVVCGDREMLTSGEVSAIADHVARAQMRSIEDAIRRVIERHPLLGVAVVTGLGAFLGARAARDAGLDVVRLSAELGEDGGRCAPACAVALLLANARGDADPEGSALRGSDDTRHADAARPALPYVGRTLQGPPQAADQGPPTAADLTVVKIGGGLLASPAHLHTILETIAACAGEHPLVIVPGGGPFANAVRAVDDQIGLSNDAAHWMAVLAMDQYAHLLASRLPKAAVVDGRDGVVAALASARIAVIAPSRWLQASDPLPHTWDVTSDSIAAWLAAAIGATHLVLIKPPGAAGPSLVDPCFERVASAAALIVRIVTADDVGGVQLALRPPSSADSIRFKATMR